ncbi:MAG: RNA polymerase sigma-70 factor [Cyclobacteriaceae bacterium]|nr:RNA polymerase sigma-70 factor [Cyclobacteriaceae bacterium]
MADHFKKGDEDILELLRKNHVQSINLLYDLYFDRMIRVAFKIVGDNEAAKDIVQEMFLNIWTKRHRLGLKDPIAPFLARAVVNRSLNYLRDNRKTRNVLPLQAIDEITRNLGQDSLEREDLERLAKLAIDSLPPKCKLIFNLSRSGEMSYIEIARHLNISKKVVEKQITKALKHLRRHLKSYLNNIVLFSFIFEASKI